MLRLALAQAPALDSPAARFDWLRDVLPEVSEQGADLIVLPELFACGYNIGPEVETRAEPVDGSTFQDIRKLAQEHDIAIHYGFSERGTDVIYNAAQCISKDGTRLSHQRKLAIPPGFERDHFTPGEGCDMFTLKGMKIATLICYDAELPETVRHVAGLGAELVLVPTALGDAWSWVADTMIPTRAYENGVYLAYANSAGVENGMRFLGSSVIAGPDGREEARAGAEPTILYAQLDPQRVRDAQARLPYLTDRHALRL